MIEVSPVGPGETLYVGDRLDNDIIPAAGLGLRTALINRGPWAVIWRGDPAGSRRLTLERAERGLPVIQPVIEALHAVHPGVRLEGLADVEDAVHAGGVPGAAELVQGLMLKRAGLPKIRLHDSRHTTFSLMEKAGVPISIISKWAGHYDSSFTMKTYVHASDEDLKQGSQALAKIHRIG
jgi:integrase